MATTEEEFYNHEQKERYFASRVNNYRSIRKIGRVIFNATKSFEEKYQKDCSNFTSTEILEMYSSFATHSWEKLLNYNSQLKIYTGWCIMESMVEDNQNHYEELDKNEIFNCLNLGLKENMITTRKALERQIQDFPNVSDQFLALAFFEGLGGMGYKDFMDLMPGQFVGNTVELSDRVLIVSPLLKEKALESAAEFDKYSYQGKMKNGYKLTDPSVVKDSSNAASEYSPVRHIRKIHMRIFSLENRYGKAYGYIGLKNSGRIDMIQRLMAEDGSSDPKATYLKHKEEIEYRYGALQRFNRWLEENSQYFQVDPQ